jgi:hypothetical protein
VINKGNAIVGLIPQEKRFARQFKEMRSLFYIKKVF